MIGKWTEEESQAFEEAIMKHGKNWKLISKYLPNRTTQQIRGHGQKWFKKYPNNSVRYNYNCGHNDK